MRLDLVDLTKCFDKQRTVLDGINFSDDIKTLALIGKSGCGKSTLLRLLGGLILPTTGRVMVDGEEAEDSHVYRRNIGFVFQQNGLFHHLSAKENITLPLIEVHKFLKEEAEDRALELLQHFGLESESEKKPIQLSGGQKQRIAIARAIAPRPKILLLDEPTSALDPEYTTEVLNMIQELKGIGISFIIATHEMGFALHACDKIVFLNEGKITEYGESETVFAFPQTEELKLFFSKLLEWRV